jgi:hypothetical protein
MPASDAAHEVYDNAYQTISHCVREGDTGALQNWLAKFTSSAQRAGSKKGFEDGMHHLLEVGQSYHFIRALHAVENDSVLVSVITADMLTMAIAQNIANMFGNNFKYAAEVAFKYDHLKDVITPDMAKATLLIQFRLGAQSTCEEIFSMFKENQPFADAIRQAVAEHAELLGTGKWGSFEDRQDFYGIIAGKDFLEGALQQYGSYAEAFSPETLDI